MSRFATSRIPSGFGIRVFPMGLERYRPMNEAGMISMAISFPYGVRNYIATT